MRLVPQERVHERVVVQTVAFFALQLKDEIVEVVQQSVDALVPQVRRVERGVDSFGACGAHQRPNR